MLALPVSLMFTVVALFFSTMWRAAWSIDLPDNFTFGAGEQSFSCDETGPLWCGGTADTNSGLMRLVPPGINKNAVTGMAIMNLPIPLHDNVTNTSLSFETSFQFSISPNEEYGPGDGMSFMLLNVSQFPDFGVIPGSLYPGAPGPGFGLYDDLGDQVVPTLAVEFDTFENHADDGMGSNHVAVDLERLVHKSARNASNVGVQLATSNPVYAWIAYDCSSNNLEITINSADSKPSKPFLQYRVNLRDVFRPYSEIYFGFAASNGYSKSFSTYVVTYWTAQFFSDMPTTTPPSSGGTQVRLLAVIIGSTVVGLLIIIVLFVCCTKRLVRRKNVEMVLELEQALDPVEEQALEPELRNHLQYTYTQLKTATDNFDESRKLGKGGFGTVYHGVMPSTGQVIAVKRVNTDSKQGIREFVAEVKIIGELRHRNVVRLYGWCMKKKKLLLVYEYVPNGSLDKLLFEANVSPSTVPREDSVGLSWDRRWQIIVGVAEGLHYLHNCGRLQVIHRDIKSSNVMLDDKFNALLGDFGLARMVNRQEDTTGINTGFAGTFGYIAPEVAINGKFTTKTDVYSFGAVALELVCGRIAHNVRLPEEQMLLVDWVWQCYEENQLHCVVDPRLNGEFEEQQTQLLLLVGLSCSHPFPDYRPTMRQVLDILAGVGQVPSIPRSKPSLDSRPERDVREGSQIFSSVMTSGSNTTTSTSESGRYIASYHLSHSMGSSSISTSSIQKSASL